jgi:predicted nuclease of predicted toxin-antitoxin system
VSIRAKVDEDLPRQIAEILRTRGHDALTVADQGCEGTQDEDLRVRLQAERRWLITADEGFADLRRYPPGSHAGVMLLRSPEESRRGYVELAAMALERLDLDEIAGAVVVVTPRGLRIRRAPSS